jgi:CheY-like chemotaxis protein
MSIAGLLLCDDLMFTSRITGTARDLGLAVEPVRSAEALRELIGKQQPRCLLLDLAVAGPAVADLVRLARTECVPPAVVVAYGSHVDTATLRAAREAGCDLVLPRSKFVEDLPHTLADWLAGRAEGRPAS